MRTAVSPRVLVIDDALDVRRTFGRFLTLDGMQPSYAADGVEGLAAARVSPPDLVVCDVEMPKMGGVALCAALRADEATRRLPIVIVTGSGSAGALAALAAGCDAVLPKPCSRALLIATIRDLLGRAEAVGPAAATTSQPPPAGPH